MFERVPGAFNPVEEGMYFDTLAEIWAEGSGSGTGGGTMRRETKGGEKSAVERVRAYKTRRAEMHPEYGCRVLVIVLCL